LNLQLEWLTFKGVVLRRAKEFSSRRTSLVATVLWPIPILALNLYQYAGLAHEDTITQVLSSSYGISSFSGMIILGTIIYLLYNSILWGAGTSLQQERWQGTIEPLLLTPANRMTILLASSFSSLIEGSWWIGTIFIISWLVFRIQVTVADWFAVMLALASTMIALVALGAFLGSFFILVRAADQLAAGLQAPIRYLSGVAFPIAALPSIFQLFAYMLPLTYGIQALRKAVVQHATIGDLAGDMAALYLFTAVFVVMGFLLLKRVEARAKRNGSLYSL
jgi:ABC-2 type transport system permease protein